MPDTLIGRKEERTLLTDALRSGRSEMVAVFGRRRVGKTFLIRQVYGEHMVFTLTGLQTAELQAQLQNFSFQLGAASGDEAPAKTPKNWLEAFFMLSQFLEAQPADKKQVVFFDEVPWLAGPKSDFVMGLGWFWNSWAEMRNVVVVICGSAASWMIQKIVRDRGGLHNRITRRIFLEPFTLAETEAYLQSRNIALDRYAIAQLYMALGGIPHYLKEVKPGKSATQNINDICFSPKGLLYDEFVNLYPALFANPEPHMAVVRALAQAHQGLSRSDIVQTGKLSEGGNTSRVLEELEQSNFITSYHPWGKRRKDTLFRLTDEYSLFYLRFVEPHRTRSADTWNHLSQTQAAKTWAGFAFENLCMKHVAHIKKALGISGVYTEQSSWRYVAKTPDDTGAQIDLLLDRKDNCINLIEIKFWADTFTVDKAYADALRTKQQVFQSQTKTRKSVLLTLITPFGAKENAYYLSQVQSQVTLDALFEG